MSSPRHHLSHVSSGSASAGSSSSSSSSSGPSASNLANLFKSPYVWGSALLVAVGAAGYAFVAASRQEKVDRRSARLRRLIRTGFSTYKGEIVSLVSKKEWCMFSRKEVSKIHDAMCRLKREAAIKLDPEHGSRVDLNDGRLSHQAMVYMYQDKLDVRDDQVILSLFQIWDRDNDDFVDFEELVYGLHIIVHGSPHEKMQRYFDAFDVDHSGWLDVEELVHCYTAFYPEKPPAEIKKAAREFIEDLDRDGDNRVSLSEFMNSYVAQTVDSTANDMFAVALCSVFGLDIRGDGRID